MAVYPLVLGGVSLIALDHRHLRGAHGVGNVERALYQGLIVSGVLAAAGVPARSRLWMMDDVTIKARRASQLLRGGGDATERPRLLALHADRHRHHRRACS